MWFFQLNFKSGKPVYLQIVDQVKAAAASGSLHAGDSLPSIRPLAEQLRVNRNTVAKAYAELESQGVVESSPGKPSVLSDKASPLKKEVRLKMLAEEIDAVVAQAHHLQVPGPELMELVQKRLEVFERANNDQKT